MRVHRTTFFNPSGFASHARLAAVCVITALLTACASGPPSATSHTGSAAYTVTAPADPSRWIGRWFGAGAAALQIMPAAGDKYRIRLRSNLGFKTHYQATAANGRLFFQRADKTLAIRPGRGDEDGNPALAGLTDCLIIVPGGQAYCRHPDTVDALPLVPGAYVTVKKKCSAAQPADTLYFDGKALSRPGQHNCRAHVVRQQGIAFHIRDACAATQSSTASGQPNETLRVPDRHHLALRSTGGQPALYRHCSLRLLPPNLQNEAPGH